MLRSDSPPVGVFLGYRQLADQSAYAEIGAQEIGAHPGDMGKEYADAYSCQEADVKEYACP